MKREQEGLLLLLKEIDTICRNNSITYYDFLDKLGVFSKKNSEEDKNTIIEILINEQPTYYLHLYY